MDGLLFAGSSLHRQPEPVRKSLSARLPAPTEPSRLLSVHEGSVVLRDERAAAPFFRLPLNSVSPRAWSSRPVLPCPTYDQ
jgi:hypothetical protein